MTSETREPRDPRAGQPSGPGASGQLSYEQARDQLLEVVQRLESGGVPLAESMALWERGEQLAATCQQWLDGARARIDAARQSASGGTPDAGDS